LFFNLSEAEYLFVALAAGVAAAAAVGVAVCASSGTIGFAAFFDGFSEADSAQAGRTGAFHLGCSSHLAFSWWVYLSRHTSEHIFRYMSRECKKSVTKGWGIALI